MESEIGYEVERESLAQQPKEFGKKHFWRRW
jgi:hypothetical protein